MITQSCAVTPRGKETCLVFPMPPAPTAPMVDPSLNLLRACQFPLPTILHHQVPSPSPGHPNISFGHCTTESVLIVLESPLTANNSSSLVANLSITVETSCFSPQLVTTKPDASLCTVHRTGGGSLPLVEACTIRANEGVWGGVVAT